MNTCSPTREGSSGRPSALRTITVPLSAGIFEASTEVTRSSADTGGSDGSASAPAGMVNTPKPTATAAVTAKAAVASFIVFLPLVLVLRRCTIRR